MSLMTRHLLKQLNEVVIAGAHDAGIYTGGLKDNIQTQYLPIGQQAAAGCRFFDLRIAYQKVKSKDGTQYIPKAYHAEGRLVESHRMKDKHQSNFGGRMSEYQDMKVGSGLFGDWGDDLHKMLTEAKSFVQSNPDEFLILKFAKCFNYPEIANSCLAKLDGKHYARGGNLNTSKLARFAGSVITIFPEEARGLSLMPNDARIMYYRELFDVEAQRTIGYLDDYQGLQYFGKFSSTDSISDNAEKQTATLRIGARTESDAIGMMYWTTTGFFDNIDERNDRMWTETNVRALKATWGMGLKCAIEARLGQDLNGMVQYAGGRVGNVGNQLKSFMPNVVMVDFLNTSKCNIIDELNDVSAVSLQQLVRNTTEKKKNKTGG